MAQPPLGLSISFHTNAGLARRQPWALRRNPFGIRAEYSLQCSGAGCNATDNNGNLRRQENHVPENEAASVYQTFTQVYDYDTLNRLQDVTESKSVTGGALTQSWAQAYTYDRFGNRSINQSGTTQGVGLNSMQAAVVANTTNNRMYAPGETEQSHPLINYDSAGNQSKDYYSVAGVSYDRTYDAENRMVSSTATDTFGSLTSTYTYDANGARVKRNVAGTETWQVYGLGGLMAEYAASGTATSPQKEYGYRNGQLLITAAAQSGAEARANVALASNGATASAQNYTQDGVCMAALSTVLRD
jgi:YD repeat-containing protein